MVEKIISFLTIRTGGWYFFTSLYNAWIMRWCNAILKVALIFTSCSVCSWIHDFPVCFQLRSVREFIELVVILMLRIIGFHSWLFREPVYCSWLRKFSIFKARSVENCSFVINRIIVLFRRLTSTLLFTLHFKQSFSFFYKIRSSLFSYVTF